VAQIFVSVQSVSCLQCCVTSVAFVDERAVALGVYTPGVQSAMQEHSNS